VPFGHFTELNSISMRLDGRLRRCAMPLEPTPIGIKTSQTVPGKKMEQGSQLNNSEPSQKTERSPSSAVNLKERGIFVLAMEIPSLTCELMLR
jgi:hypothetical protein